MFIIIIIVAKITLTFTVQNRLNSQTDNDDQWLDDSEETIGRLVKC